MEIIEVQAKSFLIHWREVPAGSDVKWQVRPLKKSVSFGLYRHKVSTGHTEHTLTTPNNSVPLSERLASQGFEAISELERLPGNETAVGGCTAVDAGMLAFVFDNTFSKSTPKTIEFWLSCTDASGKEALTEVASDISSGSLASASSNSVASSDQSTTRSRNVSSASSLSTAPSEASTKTTSTSKESDSEGSGIRRSLDRRYITGVLNKKRRKKMQGYAKRFFSLDTRLGQLHYYINPGSSYLRGVMPIRICELQTNKPNREITLDSGLEKWSLRALTSADYDAWLSAFEECLNPSVSHVVGRQGQGLSPTHSRRSSISMHSLATALDGDSKTTQETDDTSGPRLDPEVVANLVKRLGEVFSTLDFESRTTLSEILKDFDVILTPHGFSVASHFKKHKRPHLRQKRQRVQRLLLNVFLAIAAVTLVSTAYGMSLVYILLLLLVSIVAAVGGTALTFPKIEDLQETYEDIVSGLPDDAYDDDGYSSDGNESDSEEEEQDEKAAAADEAAAAKAAADASKSQPSDTLQVPPVRADPDIAASSPGLAAAAASAALYGHSRQPSNVAPIEKVEEVEDDTLPPLPHSAVKRRQDIKKPTHSPPSLYSMIRRSAGKDLSSMTAPVTSNEPISVLQRLCEQLEYSELLDKASESAGDQRLLYVALFSVSALSAARVKERALRKPFNPLLGETYECVREDKDFRFVSEKVSHRPPVFATQAESPRWTMHWTSRPHQKIWGKSAEITDSGPCLISFKDGEVINFMMPDCFLRNLIAGEKYLEPVGTLTIESSTGHSVTIHFKQGGMFSGRSEELQILNGDKVIAEGKWTESMSTPSGTTLWRAGALVENAKQKYGWTKFTASLNEITSLENGMLPPNDSRNRPDQRFYEDGNVDEAERLKLLLEEHQRQRRKEYEEGGKSQEPMFFTKSKNSLGYFQLKAADRNYWKMRTNKTWEGIPDYMK